jgi:hypothetical protein
MIHYWYQLITVDDTNNGELTTQYYNIWDPLLVSAGLSQPIQKIGLMFDNDRLSGLTPIL